VRDWNKLGGQTCTLIRFQDFGQKAALRRNGLVRFLAGLFDRNYLTFMDLEERHRLSNDGEPSGQSQPLGRRARPSSKSEVMKRGHLRRTAPRAR
jgi:hypothetical protein